MDLSIPAAIVGRLSDTIFTWFEAGSWQRGFSSFPWSGRVPSWVRLLLGVVVLFVVVSWDPAQAEVSPTEEVNPSQAAEYGAQVAKTVLALQQFRETQTISVRTPQGKEGTVTLTNLNPTINTWFLLQLSWSTDSRGSAYHLENPNPKGQRFKLDPTFPSGIAVVEDENQYPCDLNLASAQNFLDQARASQSVYAPVCGGRVILRNATKGHRTNLEAVTDFLRDEVWGGEKVIVFVRNNVTSDSYRETADFQTVSEVGMRGAVGLDSDAAPLPALVDPRFADRLVVPVNVGIPLETSMTKGVQLGAWYRVSGNPGIYFSMIQPNVIAPEILQSHKTLVSYLDGVEASSLCYLVAFDLDRFDLGYALGTEHPRVGWSARTSDHLKGRMLPGPDGIGGVTPLVTTGLINPADARRTVATFTGGFKRQHGAFKHGELALRNAGSHYGFVEDGVVLSKLQPGLATLFVLADGTISMKTWTEADNAQLARVRFARQNGVPLVEYDEVARQSRPGSQVAHWGPGNWSGSAEEKLRTLRAGAALQQTHAKRFLLYALFSDATPSAMARVFQAYACRYAMLLDMNALEHTYMAVYRTEGSRRVVDHLVKGMSQFEKKGSEGLLPRFLGYPDNRDCFYLMRHDVREFKP
ncbi:MAG TPA: hypothetical protein DCZ69_00685 [Syntrophobacteraceae bacterium]|nr:hypothetical protein [Syntrophobacteraceae bacterium]